MLFTLRYRDPVAGGKSGLIDAFNSAEAELIGRRWCEKAPRGIRGGLAYVSVEPALLADIAILGETEKETTLRRAGYPEPSRG